LPQSALTGLLSGQRVASKWARAAPSLLKIGIENGIRQTGYSESPRAAINARFCLLCLSA